MTIAKPEYAACTLPWMTLHAISPPKPKVQKTEADARTIIKPKIIKAQINTNLLACLAKQSIILARSIGRLARGCQP
ncbi:MAG TPA: hypothetical protein VEG28_01015 [Dehalococcoidia bacterium]|nr:hypothetical protein [Dehalococcoidia bacterium]